MERYRRRDYEVYIVIAVASLGSFLISDSNVSVNIDRINAIDSDINDLDDEIDKLRASHDQILSLMSDHKSQAGHVGQLTLSEQISIRLEKINDRLIYLERSQAYLESSWKDYKR
jgi:hypothetical protein